MDDRDNIQDDPLIRQSEKPIKKAQRCHYSLLRVDKLNLPQ